MNRINKSLWIQGDKFMHLIDKYQNTQSPLKSYEKKDLHVKLYKAALFTVKVKMPAMEKKFSFQTIEEAENCFNFWTVGVEIGSNWLD